MRGRARWAAWLAAPGHARLRLELFALLDETHVLPIPKRLGRCPPAQAPAASGPTVWTRRGLISAPVDDGECQRVPRPAPPHTGLRCCRSAPCSEDRPAPAQGPFSVSPCSPHLRASAHGLLVQTAARSSVARPLCRCAVLTGLTERGRWPGSPRPRSGGQLPAPARARRRLPRPLTRRRHLLSAASGLFSSLVGEKPFRLPVCPWK